MRLITFALLPLLLVACAPTVSTVELSAAETQAIETALLKDFWDGDKPHSACAFHPLGREGRKFYVYSHCQHWEQPANGLQLGSGGGGPAVVTLGEQPTVKHPRNGRLMERDVRALFPAELHSLALGHGPNEFYGALIAEAEAKAKAAP